MWESEKNGESKGQGGLKYADNEGTTKNKERTNRRMAAEYTGII